LIEAGGIHVSLPLPAFWARFFSAFFFLFPLVSFTGVALQEWRFPPFFMTVSARFADAWSSVFSLALISAFRRVFFPFSVPPPERISQIGP